MKTLKELLHLTYNEDGKYIVSWRRPDFQVEDKSQSEEISKEDFELLGKLFHKGSSNIIFNFKEDGKIVVYKDGSYKIVEDGITWEYEDDEDWLCTISLNNLKEPIEEIPQFKGTLQQLNNLSTN